MKERGIWGGGESYQTKYPESGSKYVSSSTAKAETINKDLQSSPQQYKEIPVITICSKIIIKLQRIFNTHISRMISKYCLLNLKKIFVYLKSDLALLSEEGYNFLIIFFPPKMSNKSYSLS